MEVEHQRVPQGRYREVSAEPFLHNAPRKRPEGQSFIAWWKNRRNAKLALKARMKHGVTARVIIDTKTMSIETSRARGYRNQKEIDNYGR